MREAAGPRARPPGAREGRARREGSRAAPPAWRGWAAGCAGLSYPDSLPPATSGSSPRPTLSAPSRAASAVGAATATTIRASGAPSAPRSCASTIRVRSGMGLRLARSGFQIVPARIARSAAAASASTSAAARSRRADANAVESLASERGQVAHAQGRRAAARAARTGPRARRPRGPRWSKGPSATGPGTSEKSSAAKPAMEVATPRRMVGQNRSIQEPSPGAPPAIGLHEEVDRVVHGLADERHPEAQRDAVHDAVPQRHGGDADQRAGGHGREAQHQHDGRAEDRQQQRPR